MRYSLLVACLALVSSLAMADAVLSPVRAQDCTGENCPPPPTDGGQGSKCHSQEDTIS